MNTVSSSKLLARVIESVDLDTLFPASILKGLVALDIQFESGSVSTGKKVWLCSDHGREELQIRGIEMIQNRVDPQVVRIHCSKPKGIDLPLREDASWMIREE